MSEVIVQGVSSSVGAFTVSNVSSDTRDKSLLNREYRISIVTFIVSKSQDARMKLTVFRKPEKNAFVVYPPLYLRPLGLECGPAVPGRAHLR